MDDDGPVGEGSESADGAAVTSRGTLDAEGCGVGVDAFGGRARAVDVFFGCGVAVEQDAPEARCYS